MSELPAVALLGFALAASPGPVNALAFVRGLRHGASHALFLVLGADSADLLYATLVILGAGPFVNRPAVQVVLSIGGGIFLAHIGVANLRGVWRPVSGPAAGALEGPSWLAGYREGFAVALLSPLTIVFWISVFGGYYADSTAHGSRTPPVLLLAVLFLGAGVWTAISVVMIHLGRKTLQGRWYAVLVTLLSVALLCFAARLVSTGVTALATLIASPGGRPR